MPEAVNWCEVGEIVVGAVDEPEFVLHDAGVGELAFVTALLGCGIGAEGEALVIVAPAGLMVGDHELGHAPAVDGAPVGGIIGADVRAMRAPDACACNMLPGRNRIGNVR